MTLVFYGVVSDCSDISDTSIASDCSETSV